LNPDSKIKFRSHISLLSPFGPKIIFVGLVQQADFFSFYLALAQQRFNPSGPTGPRAVSAYKGNCLHLCENVFDEIRNHHSLSGPNCFASPIIVRPT
jgi:hypothetical protein